MNGGFRQQQLHIHDMEQDSPMHNGNGNSFGGSNNSGYVVANDDPLRYEAEGESSLEGEEEEGTSTDSPSHHHHDHVKNSENGNNNDGNSVANFDEEGSLVMSKEASAVVEAPEAERDLISVGDVVVVGHGTNKRKITESRGTSTTPVQVQSRGISPFKTSADRENKDTIDDDDRRKVSRRVSNTTRPRREGFVSLKKKTQRKISANK